METRRQGNAVAQGETVNGRLNGVGILAFVNGEFNGDRYEGEFEDDWFYGRGVYRFADGNVT